jgi:hypothetical protein
MATGVSVALINAAGQIVIKNGGIGGGANMRSALQAVAVYVKTNDGSGEVTVRHKGCEALSCEDDSDGQSIVYERILSGPGKGARAFTYSAAGQMGAPRTLASGTEDLAASASACWDVYESGDGRAYDDALALADAAVGYP